MSPYRRLFLVVALLVLSPDPVGLRLRAADSSGAIKSHRSRDSSMSSPGGLSPPMAPEGHASETRVRVLVNLLLPGRGHVP